MKIARYLLLLLVIPLYGCAAKPDNPAAVRERTAETTAQIKRDTKAMAEGIREGWSRDKALDVNSATESDLRAVQGMTPKMAERIVSHRPYAKTSELVDRHALTKAEYDQVADRLTVKR